VRPGTCAKPACVRRRPHGAPNGDHATDCESPGTRDARSTGAPHWSSSRLPEANRLAARHACGLRDLGARGALGAKDRRALRVARPESRSRGGQCRASPPRAGGAGLPRVPGGFDAQAARVTRSPPAPSTMGGRVLRFASARNRAAAGARCFPKISTPSGARLSRLRRRSRNTGGQESQVNHATDHHRQPARGIRPVKSNCE